jgi:hypothetical protein
MIHYWLNKILPILAIIAVMTACDENTGTMGFSVVEGNDTVNINAATFNVITESVLAHDVASRNTNILLGKYKDPETDTYITAHCMTQLHTMGTEQFPPVDSLWEYHETKNLNDITADSCFLWMMVPSNIGDSLSQMKMVCHELKKPFLEGKEYYMDDIDVWKEYVRGEDGIHQPLTYTGANKRMDDNVRKIIQGNYLNIPLNDNYIASYGNPYSNYGTYLLQSYYNGDKEDFKSDYKFLRNVCPGFYFENTGGIDNIMRITYTYIRVWFSRLRMVKGVETKVAGYIDFPGTEEVMQLTFLDRDKEKLEQLVELANLNDVESYIKAPASIYTQVTLPVMDVMNQYDSKTGTYTNHETDTLNTARLFIPRINEETEVNPKFKLSIPQTILMVPTDSLSSFFQKRKTTDNRTTFIATYASNTNGYTYNNISTLISTMYRNFKKSGKSIMEYEKENPNWNKVLLVPVQVNSATFNTTTVTMRVMHDMSLATTRLVQGKEDTSGGRKISLSVVYSNSKRKE